MDFATKLKNIRSKHHQSQAQMAQQLNVSRAAIAKWESNRGLPDISNILVISETYNISLDSLLGTNDSLQKKVVHDSQTKKWHYLIVLYLLTTLVYIAYLALAFKAYLIGFFISTVFVLVLEIRILLRARK